MKKLLKVLMALVVVFVLLIVGAVVAVAWYVDDIAKKAIQDGGTQALGVQTTLDDADVGILSGEFEMRGLKVANPGGYTPEHFLTLGEGGVAVTYSSLQEPTVELPEFRLEGINVSLQKKGGKANYQVILDNLKKMQGTGSSDKPAEPAPGSTGEEKKFVIRQLLISDVRIDVDMVDVPLGVGEMAKVSIPIDKIELSNVGQVGTGVKGSGVTMEELISIIVQVVLNAAVENGAGKLPVEFLNDLQGQLANLEGLKGLPMKVVGDATKALEDATKDVSDKVKDATEEAGKKLEEGIKDLGNKLKLPGEKKDDKKK